MKNDNDMLDNQDEKKEQTVDESDTIVKEDSVHLQEKVTELEAQVKRILADYQNAQKRMREEKGEWLKIANKEILLRLLPVLDTLILGSRHTEDKTLHVTLQQFLSVLESEGVKRIKAEGKDFDPKHMECVEVVSGKDNSVVEETRAGFLYHDIVLRPAQVKVGKEEK